MLSGGDVFHTPDSQSQEGLVSLLPINLQLIFSILRNKTYYQENNLRLLVTKSSLDGQPVRQFCC